ncbi:Ankyrin repeat protein [Pseudohyphozyma bogoriensis]|nr:Ankyrin repeat protein [Pseudohyphozyma bogoriensis]
MPKAPRHRKRVRIARDAATAAPLGGQGHSNGDAAAPAAPAGPTAAPAKKVGKKESEVVQVLDKLKSADAADRVSASSALAGMLLDLPAVSLRLFLSKNLIGILIERLGDKEDDVVVECLGCLRNLAVTQPPSLLSEMFNKKLLPGLLRSLGTLSPLLASQLTPHKPITAPLPSTPAQRDAAQEANDKIEQRRQVYWDWCDNLLTLLWCLSESTKKILASLNGEGVAEGIIKFCLELLGNLEGEQEEGKKKSKKSQKVPLFVGLTAAQTLHSLLSQNPPAHTHAFHHPSLESLPALLSTPLSGDATDVQQLRVLIFGIVLELSAHKKAKKWDWKEVLEGKVNVLTAGLEKVDLGDVVKSAEKSVGGGTETNPTLTAAEKTLSTLQLSLEVLGSWCTSLDLAALSSSAAEDGEEWGGIAEGQDDDGDIGMMEDDAGVFGGSDDEDEDDEAAEENDDMMDDSEDANFGGELSSDALSLISNLPAILLRLSTPTSISFATVAPTPSTSVPASAIPTSTTAIGPTVPAELAGLSETLTTVHVRALECLNNLFITLSSSKADVFALVGEETVNKIWEDVLGAVQRESLSGGKQAAVAGEEDEVEERRMEVVMAGVGVAWGLARLGVDKPGKLIVGPGTTPFLTNLFAQHPFATASTPAGESTRVRIAGILSCVGRRGGVSNEENAAIGTFLLSVLPDGKTPSPLNPTAEVLIQTIDSIIDLYADEESSWDSVFRTGGFLQRLEGAIPGVRAATKKIDRKRFPTLRNRADGALDNLVAFAGYRKDVA